MKAPLSHPTLLSEELLLRSCDIQRTRGSGPGGQHRNKVETAIVITHQPTGVTGQASERRSQHKNREVATQRLRLNLALQVRTAVTADDPPSELWQIRVRSRKINVSSSHFDFATLLAEAIDRITAMEFDLSAAAKHLSISTSQLVKFLKVEPAAMQMVNAERKERGLHPLK